ncbi:TPA: DUF1270 family protein [Staphylococcus aureus]|nr:DUF1270 family protein [Staphylococcus aureus]
MIYVHFYIDIYSIATFIFYKEYFYEE